MKLVIVVADGAADGIYHELGLRTPLQAARTPWMDRIAREGRVGWVRTQYDNLPIGSQVAFLGLFGVDPHIPNLDRSYFEALALGLDIGPDDVVFRCNIVKMKGDQLADFTAGQIGEAEVERYVSGNLPKLPADLEFYHTNSYRNLLVWRSCPYEADEFGLALPHESVGMRLDDIGPGDPYTFLADLPGISRYRDLLLWPWGASQSVELPQVSYSLGVVTAMQFLAGMTIAVGGEAIIPEGATGYIDSDYASKYAAACKLLHTQDVVIVHCNAPDEESHVGHLSGKIAAIEKIDDLVRDLFLHLDYHHEEWRIVVTIDHHTSAASRMHEAGLCPYAISGVGTALPNHVPHFSDVFPGPYERILAAKEAIRAWLG